MKHRDKIQHKPADELAPPPRRTADLEALESKHQRMEAVLQESQEFYQTLYEEALTAYFSVGVDGRIKMANPRAAELLGYTQDELVGRPVLDLYADTPAGKVKAEAMLRRFAGGEDIRQEELEMRTADGRKLWGSLSVQPIRDEKGQVTASRSIVSDIAERKRAEEDLRRSEQDLAIRNQVANIFLALPDEEIYAEVLQVILERMESKYGVFGYIDDNGDLVCPSMTRDIWDQCQIPDKDIIFPRQKWGGIWGRALIEKKTLYSNKPLPAPEGHIPIRRVLVVPLTYEGEVIGILAVANKPTNYNEKDIQVLETIANHIAPILKVRLQMDRKEKDRKRAEKLFRTVCDSSPIGIYIAQDGKFQYVNPQFQHLLGYSESELLGTDSASYILPADRDVVRSNAIARLKGKQVVPYEYRVIDKAGDIRYIMETVNSIEYQGRRAVLGNFMDITELKRLEKEMAEYKALNKFKSDLLSTVSHELRTPLSIIKGYSTLLVDYDQSLSPEEKREYLRSADSATDRLSELVDRLLDMSRLDAGLLTLTREPTSILKLVRDTVAEAQLTAPGYKIVTNAGKRLPRLTIDARRIRQVLDNLIDNACKYSEEGTEVTVSARRTGKKLLISVADQGIGIPANELQRVFDRMYRIEQRPSSMAGGMGLGLAICKGLIEAHGGRIWMESEEEKGSTCFFTLPLHTSAGQGNSKKGVGQGQFPL